MTKQPYQDDPLWIAVEETEFLEAALWTVAGLLEAGPVYLSRAKEHIQQTMKALSEKRVREAKIAAGEEV